MNIYRDLAVREIKKKKHSEFMNRDPSINNRPVAGGVLPSPTTFLQLQLQPIQAFQRCLSPLHTHSLAMNARIPHPPVHCHTHVHTYTRIPTQLRTQTHVRTCLGSGPLPPFPTQTLTCKISLNTSRQASPVSTFRQIQAFRLRPAHTMHSCTQSHPPKEMPVDRSLIYDPSMSCHL